MGRQAVQSNDKEFSISFAFNAVAITNPLQETNTMLNA